VRILVTGAGGQLAGALARFAGPGHEIVALGVDRLDITDAAAVERTVDSMRPDAIVNAAAYTAVDKAESEPALAETINGIAPGVLASQAAKRGLPIVQISTDYVFDGDKAEPYVEADPPAPRSVYGASKLAGERATDPSRDAVVRISWVCGATGSNMVKTILRLANAPGELRFVDDQRGHPTLADDAARMLVRLAAEGRTGTWHVTNQGAVSWYGFAREVLRLAGHDAARVVPIATSDLVPPRPAPRPANSVLDNAALRAADIPLLDDFRVPLARLVATLGRVAR